MKKILITGVNGFVGRHLAASLIASGYEVFGITRKDSHPPALLRGQTFNCSVTDASGVSRIVSDLKPDTVIHLAAAHGPSSRTVQGAQVTIETNIEGTLAVLDACRTAHTGVILVSSSAVYSPSPDPIAEESLLSLDTPYALSKYGAECCAKFFADRHQIPLTIVRPFQHSGGGQKPITFVSSLLQQIAQIEQGLRKPIIHIENPENLRDYLDVGDVVSAYQLLLEHEMKGDIFNVCSGRQLSIRQIAQAAVGLAKVPIEICESVSGEPSVSVGSHEKLTRETGWHPQFDFLNNTLHHLLQYWRDYYSQLKANG